MRIELSNKLSRVTDSTSAMLLLADVDDPVLNHDTDGGPTSAELAEFNRLAHRVVSQHLGLQKAREVLTLMAVKETQQGLGCWACRVLQEFIPENGGPSVNWVGVA